MKLLHIGDIHLREAHADDTLRCLRYLLYTGAMRGLHALLLAGDVFDAKSTPLERKLFASWLQDLRAEYGGVVIIARGNHDAPNDLPVWELAPDVIVFERPGVVGIDLAGECIAMGDSGTGDPFVRYSSGFDRDAEEAKGIDVLVMPWPERAWLSAFAGSSEAVDQAGGAALVQLLKAMSARRPYPDRPFVVLGHLSVVGASTSSGQPLVGREIQIGRTDLVDLGARYVALGHIHRAQSLGQGVHYAGSLTRHDHGEESEDKGVYAIEIDADDAQAPAEVKWIPVPARTWLTINARWDADEQRIVEDGGNIKVSVVDAMVRYRYSCPEAEAHRFNHEQIRDRFKGARELKIVPTIERPERVRAAEIAAATDLQAKLRAWCDVVEMECSERMVTSLDLLVAGEDGRGSS